VHPDAEEDDVAERGVAHLSAEQVPGEREDDHHPEEGKLGLVGRRQERQGEQQRPGADVAENGLHARYLRCRESQNRRSTRITTSLMRAMVIAPPRTAQVPKPDSAVRTSAPKNALASCCSRMLSPKVARMEMNRSRSTTRKMRLR